MLSPIINATPQVNAPAFGVKSAAATPNVEQASAVQALQSEGKLVANQFAFTKLPRDVLFLQNERDTKVKLTQHGDQVSSSNSSDFDEERDLEKVDDKTDLTPRLDRLKARNPARQDVGQFTQGAPQQQPQTAAVANARATDARLQTQRIEERVNTVARSEAQRESTPAAFARAPEKPEPPRKSVVGKPTSVYSTIQSVLTPKAPRPDDVPQEELNVLA